MKSKLNLEKFTVLKLQKPHMINGGNDGGETGKGDKKEKCTEQSTKIVLISSSRG